MIFDRFIQRGPSRAEIKQLIDEVDEQNQLYKAMYEQMFPGQSLRKDYKMKDYIKDGYEKNADVFSVIDRLSTMFAQVPINVVMGDDEEVVLEGDLVERMKQPNNYQLWQEFAKLWYTFFLTTGNAITYAPRIVGGNDKGKLMPGGMYLMPTQNVDIKSGGWRDPIKEYTLDLSGTTERIPAEDVMHVRMPNLQYTDGANFMGMSPLKVAALIIEAENQGYQTVADTLARGIPPGILTKVDESYDEDLSKTQQKELERTYKQKYGNQKYKRNAGVPVLTVGNVKWVKMGFDNFRDLQILEMNQHGLRVLCNVLGVPSQAFNDVSGTTFSNMNDARKMVYTNRLIPDLGLLIAYLNVQVAPAYGEGLKSKADYSNVPELQDDKQKVATWANIGVANGSVTRNEFRKLIGLDQVEDEGMDSFMAPFNLVPVGEIGMDVEIDSEKILKDNDIDDYKRLKAV